MQHDSCSLPISPSSSSRLKALWVWLSLALGLWSAAWLMPQSAQALPIGFGKNQGDQIYHELKSKNFIVYFDKDAPHEAAGILRSLEAGKPVIEYWLGRTRLVPLPVIMSSMTANASFANFITDAIELQTLGKGGRDLAWHEFVHSSMYLHLDNFLGPAGSIIYLPFMPSWWIEGLAEAITLSHGSADILAVERHAALTDSFPSFARLHSLYGKGAFARTGYAISAGLVHYILSTYGYDKLVPILTDFYDYAQPWYWPWAAVPLNGFLPMDRALENATGKNAKELYKDYKAARTSYWQKHLAKQGVAAEYSYEDTWYSPTLSSKDGVVSALFTGRSKAGLYQMKVPAKADHDTALAFAGGLHSFKKFPNGTREMVQSLSKNQSRSKNQSQQVRLTEREGKQRLELWAPKKDAASGKTFWRKQRATKARHKISRLSLHKGILSYMTEGLESSGLCYRNLKESGKDFAKEYCPLVGKGPITIKAIDEGKGRYRWVARGVETSVGTQHSMLRFDSESLKFMEMAVDSGGRPLEIEATEGGGYWLLASTYQGRRFRRLTSEGRCVKEAKLPYASRQFEILGPHTLVVDGFSPQGSGLVRVNIRKKPFGPCEPSFDRMSPVLYQLASGDPLDDGSFSKAMTAAGVGQSLPSAAHDALRSSLTQHTKAFLGQNAKPLAKTATAADGEGEAFAASQDDLAAWYKAEEGSLALHRFRPVFALPWLGRDSEGLTFGTVSVPLMDHRQNHSVRLNFLYGLTSKFPNTELHYRNTRYRPTINVKAFRYQTYNGTWAFNDEPAQAYYYDEIGGSISAGRAVLPWLSLGLGLKISHLEPYIGPNSFFDTKRQGMRTLLMANFGAGTKVGPLYLSVGGTAQFAPAALNEAWDYQKYRLATKVTLPFNLMWRTHQLSWGLQLGVTDGEPSKIPLLRETYRPLQTYIPGGGGVNNQFHFSIVGLGGLTQAKNGDRSYRNELVYTVPVIPDLDILWGIFYMERLDFSLFYNYGNAWYDGFPASEGDPIQALGYAFDLQSDLKGVNLNFGLGAGKVLGEDLAYYGQFGFNALID